MIQFKPLLLLGCASLALSAGMAQAQDVGQTPPPQDEATEVGDVVVTAERREQTLQNYAGVAQAITGEDLRAVGIDQIEDLQSAIPGLSISNQEGNVQIYIRGVGTAQQHRTRRSLGRDPPERRLPAPAPWARRPVLRPGAC